MLPLAAENKVCQWPLSLCCIFLLGFLTEAEVCTVKYRTEVFVAQGEVQSRDWKHSNLFFVAHANMQLEDRGCVYTTIQREILQNIT